MVPMGTISVWKEERDTSLAKCYPCSRTRQQRFEEQHLSSLVNYHKRLFHFQVLKSCAASPKTVEVLFNSYQHIQVTEEWIEAIPDEIFQVYSPGKKAQNISVQNREIISLCLSQESTRIVHIQSNVNP